MYHIAIVDDDKEFAMQLQKYLMQYGKENMVEFQVSLFYDGTEILNDYHPRYDAIFFDIEMKQMNGMEAAERVREMDEDVVIMFITNMAQYALFGYSVGALDFVMKPITYYTFSMKLRRVLKRIQKKVEEQKTIVLNLPDGVKKIDTGDIYFVEVENRMLHYHTTEGEFVLKGTMHSVEEMLKSDSFFKCNHWYMVNLKHVKEVRKNIAVVGEHELEISRRNKTPFMKALTQYLGGTT